ncbi:hypothetical protein QFC21_003042 [Naganishia friedmannii]|uniref:Uncharacterized protein n=1 Tax=Naganishia friedmannii TaxID=89922 RepID=A0ACC2VRG7_9TREE|nr:hypothetical protein QFC21_003042 [Naganishia friedmannii]
MPPIRALPWTNTQELAQVYAWIWEEPEDEASTGRAVARIATYLAHPSTPLFLPLLHSLLTSALLPSPPLSAQHLLTTRLAISSTLIRFVNSLVDPLQTTAYAKPISLLARQLRIPSSLVAIRHAATHEDLPTYEALRTALEQATEWIRVEVMLPLVFPQNNTDNPANDTDNQTTENESQEYLSLVKKYKSLLRAFYRERTSTNAALWSGARELRMTLRALEDKLEGLSARGQGDKREEQARWLARRVLFAERGGLVPNARKRPQWNPSTGLPHPGEAEIRIWTPLLALIADKFAAASDGDSGEGFNDNDNEEEGGMGWSTWCLSEGIRLVLSYIETRDERLQWTNPLVFRPTGQTRKQHGGKGKEVVPFAHDADYLGLPDDEEEEEKDGSNPIESVGVEEGDAEQQEKEEFMACLVGWLAFFLGGSPSSAIPNNSTTTTNARGSSNTTTGKRRRTGQASDSLPLEISVGGTQESGAWTVAPQQRRMVVRELVKGLSVDVVRRTWEMLGQESEQGKGEGEQRAHKLVRKEDLLLLLIRGDSVCEALVRRLAEGGGDAHELREESREKESLEDMEHRLETFRKMRQSTATITEVDDDDAGDEDESRKRMRGWARVDGWKECPIGHWRS